MATRTCIIRGSTTAWPDAPLMLRIDELIVAPPKVKSGRGARLFGLSGSLDTPVTPLPTVMKSSVLHHGLIRSPLTRHGKAEGVIYAT